MPTPAPTDLHDDIDEPAADRDDGQGLAEYALILALIAILAITSLLFLSGQINTILSTIGVNL